MMGESLRTGNIHPIASFDTGEVEITYSYAHDGPQSCSSELGVQGTRSRQERGEIMTSDDKLSCGVQRTSGEPER